jgi:hypothetical protein
MGLLVTTPAQQAANQLRQITKQSFQQLSNAGIQGYNLLWKNNNATPAAIVAALGTDAAGIFALAQLNISTVTTAASIGGAPIPEIPSVPTGVTVTPNADGTVTLTGSPT